MEFFARELGEEVVEIETSSPRSIYGWRERPRDRRSVADRAGKREINQAESRYENRIR